MELSAQEVLETEAQSPINTKALVFEEKGTGAHMVYEAESAFGKWQIQKALDREDWFCMTPLFHGSRVLRGESKETVVKAANTLLMNAVASSLEGS